MTNKYHTVLYVGVTGNLGERLRAHREGSLPGFSATYRTTKLIYLEQHAIVPDAITREKEIKKWRREKKIALIESINPRWDDLYERLEI